MKLTAPVGAAVVVTVTNNYVPAIIMLGTDLPGVLYQSVKAPGGGVVFPRGAHVVGTVVAAKGQGKFKGSGALGIQVTSISGTPVSVSSYEKEQKGKGKRTAGFIGGGAGGGALIGGLAGGGKGALIGGLIGAGAGTAGAAFTGNKDVVIPSESTISFHLTAPVTITVMPKETRPRHSDSSRNISKDQSTCPFLCGQVLFCRWRLAKGFAEEKVLAVDWIHAVESGFSIVCDRCRALPF